MDLEKPTQENLNYILSELTKLLDVANKTLFDPKHYDLNKYSHLKSLYDSLLKKGSLSSLETQAFIDELRFVRKE